ncbi:MAG: TIGR00269 family protein [Candidatus Diapherotrites archaeon]|nr:TIGR00269 family protein [Candidatus Diapherotrites archaeon]
MNPCQECGEPSVITLAYGPHYFCKKHFLHFFEKRVRKTIRVNRLIEPKDKVVVGVSGGKDSMATLFLLQKILGKTISLHALMLDEGIPGYRDKAIAKAVDGCEQWGIPYTVAKHQEEVGYSTTEVFQKIQENPKLGSSCGYCGTFRREILNRKAIEMKATKLATGHNLDDEMQSVAMNLFTGDLFRLARLGPRSGNHELEGFVPRIKPLYECPEKEVMAYANLAGIPHYSDECCPYSWMAKRNHFRKAINDLEANLPGSKFALLSSFRQLKPMLAKEEFRQKANLQKCVQCGQVTTQTVCGACKLIKRLNESTGKNEAPSHGAGLLVPAIKRGKKLTCATTKGYRPTERGRSFPHGETDEPLVQIQ